MENASGWCAQEWIQLRLSWWSRLRLDVAVVMERRSWVLYSSQRQR